MLKVLVFKWEWNNGTFVAWTLSKSKNDRIYPKVDTSTGDFQFASPNFFVLVHEKRGNPGTRPAYSVDATGW